MGGGGGAGEAARYPATGLVTEQGVGGEPGREPTGLGTQVPFQVGTFSTSVPGYESRVLGRGRKGMVVAAAFLVPSSPTLVPHPHLFPPRTRVRGSRSLDHTACKGLENSARTGKFTLTRGGSESPPPQLLGTPLSPGLRTHAAPPAGPARSRATPPRAAPPCQGSPGPAL